MFALQDGKKIAKDYFGRPFDEKKKTQKDTEMGTTSMWGIFIGVMILSWIVSAVLKSKFKKYLKVPVDINASKRALACLNTEGIIAPQNQNMAEDSLKWAASTYVVAALGSLATLLYYVMIFTGARED
jgi:Zn-dependent membrane protease YugP